MKTPDWFENYHSLTESQFRIVNDNIKSFKSEIQNLKDNHLAHLDNKVTKIGTNQEWLIKSYWIIAGASISSLVTAISILIFK